MSSEWNKIDTSSQLIDSYFFYPFYNQLNSIAQEYSCVQLSAPFIGLVDGIASLAQATGSVAEATIKGTRNLVYGGKHCDRESLERGSLQIILGGGFVAVVSLPLIAIRSVRITIGILTDPVKTTHTQAENYRQKIFSSTELPNSF